MKKLCCLLFLSFLFLSLRPPIQAISSDSRFIVKYDSRISRIERLKIKKEIEAKVERQIDKLDAEVLTVKGETENKLSRLRRDSRVLYVEPDFVATTLEVSNDPAALDQTQWALWKIQAAGTGVSAWNYTHSTSSIKIGILDTGIDQDHEDLSSKIVENQNCTDSPTVDDLYGHGTHVAGIAGAITNNGIGVAGVGFDVALANYKSLGDSGSGYYSWIADCIVRAADGGVKVINMSLGGPNKSKTLENAINYAWNKGVVLVAAAGNSGNSSPTYPAYYKNVIAVAATDQSDKKASFSSYGKWVDVAAPGVSIYSTFPNHSYRIGKNLNYDFASGTSMATPVVSGLAALVWSSGSPNNIQFRNQTEYQERADTGFMEE